MVRLASASRRMSVFDAARLRMDARGNPMVVTAALSLDAPLAFDDLVELVDAKLLAHARFRQRVAAPLAGVGPPAWADDPEFDPRAHLSHVAVPSPGGERELFELLGELASQPLDPARPLWHVHLVDGHEGGSVVVARVHHAIADGGALVRLVTSLADESPAATPRAAGRSDAPRSGRAGLAARAARLRDALRREPRTSIGRASSSRKTVAFTRPLPLDALRAVGRFVGGHANDALLASIAGGVRAHLLGHGDPEPLPRLRALVPVALDAGTRAGVSLGNHYASVLVALPLDVGSSRERLAATHASMSDARARASTSRAAIAALGLLGGVAAPLERGMVDVLSRRASLTFSNVVGPSAPIALANRRVRGAFVLAPAAGGIALSLTSFGYAGAVRVGLAADAHAVDDPAWLALAIEREFDALARASGVVML